MQRQPIIWYLLLYALFLAAMHFGYGFGVTEPVLILLLFGLGLSLLALWTTRHAKPRNITVKHPRQESAILGGYLVIVVSFITWDFLACVSSAPSPCCRQLSSRSQSCSSLSSCPLQSGEPLGAIGCVSLLTCAPP